MPEDDFSQIVKRCTDLEAQYSERNTMYDELEKIYLMDWENQPTREDLKITISPSSRNALQGAIRLMTATDPVFSVAYDKNDPKAGEKADVVERAANAIWYMAGRVRQSPVHYDAVISGLLFGEIQMGIVSTEDLVKSAKGGSKASILRAEKMAEMTPYTYEIYDPRTGYPEFDGYGLSAFFRKVNMKSGEVLDRWGSTAEKNGLDPLKRFEDTTYCEFWDLVTHVVWIEGEGEPLFIGAHNLPCMSVVAQITDGSSLHEKPEQKRQPFLYTVWKSGVSERQNLELTVMYSNIAAIANNPQNVYAAEDPEKDLFIDNSLTNGVIRIRKGESLTPLAQNVIDPSIMQGLEIAERLGQESTIYPQVLGAPTQGNPAFSTVSLLSQSGRLPLVAAQRLGAWCFGKVMESTFMMLKDGGGGKVRGSDGSVVKIKATDIPDNLIIDCKLDINLPQDDRQNAMVAMQLAGGEDPLLSKRHVRETYLGAGQSDTMDDEIYREKMRRTMAQIKMQEEIQKAQLASQQRMAQSQMAFQQQMQGQQQPGMPPGQPQGAPPPGQPPLPQEAMIGQQNMPMQGPAGMPPEIAAQMAGAAGNGLPAMPMTEPVQPNEEGL